jgi:hypothetical protein
MAARAGGRRWRVSAHVGPVANACWTILLGSCKRVLVRCGDCPYLLFGPGPNSTDAHVCLDNAACHELCPELPQVRLRKAWIHTYTAHTRVLRVVCATAPPGSPRVRVRHHGRPRRRQCRQPRRGVWTCLCRRACSSVVITTSDLTPCVCVIVCVVVPAGPCPLIH